MLLAYEKGVGQGAFNIGSGRGTAIREVVAAVLAAPAKTSAHWDTTKPTGEPRQGRRYYRAHAQSLGFHPKSTSARPLRGPSNGIEGTGTAVNPSPVIAFLPLWLCGNLLDTGTKSGDFAKHMNSVAGISMAERKTAPIKVGLVQINNSFSGQCYLPYAVGSWNPTSRPARQRSCFLEFMLPISPPPVQSMPRSSSSPTPTSSASASMSGTPSFARGSRARSRRATPATLIIFGGPQVPDHAGGVPARAPVHRRRLSTAKASRRS